jgi:ABC-2 type transport system ATP-binding protein
MTGGSGQSAAEVAAPSDPGQAPRTTGSTRSNTLRGAPGDAIVSMRGVTKRFGEFTAVSDLELTVPRGGLVGMIGPSGCGKTTTLRLLLGVYEPTEGECLVFGQPSHHIRRPVRERIGYLPQQFVLYPTLTVEENLGFAAATYGLGPLRRRRNQQTVLELVGLAEARKKLARDISGGMQRRLALAATLIHQPDLLFLDEPTAGIDPILREQLWSEFRRLQAEGRTQFVTTQYIAEAEYCDTVILMDHGKIVAHGAPEELRQGVAGGDLVDLTSPDLDRPMRDLLRALPGVRGLQMTQEDQVRLTVEDAGELIPRVMTAVQEGGGEVRAIEERRLSFSEVFVAILQQHGRTDAGVGRYDE